jgi:HK97 family phage major capsid protein
MEAINDAQAKQLAEKLIAHLKAPLERRETDLIEKMTRQFHEHVDGKMRDMERKRAEVVIPGWGDDQTKNYSFERLVRGVIQKNVPKIAPLEYEAHLATKSLFDHGRELTPEMRDMVAGTDSAGGFLVPPQVLEAEIIPLLRDAMVAFKAGVTRLPGLVGAPIPIPKIVSTVTPESVEETEAHTPTDITLGQINMYPHDIFAGTVLSNRLLRMSMPGAEGLVRSELVREVGIRADKLVFQGAGASNEPLGILLHPDLNELAAFGDVDVAAAYDKLIELEYLIIEDNALSIGSPPRWVMHPKVFREIRKMKDPTDNSQPKARRLLEDKGPLNLLGYEYVMSTHLPTDKFLLGVFSTVLFGEWGTMVIASSDVAGNNFRNRTTEVIVGMTMDVAVRQPTALARAIGVTYT